jgi:hypothetical protein
MADYSKWIEKHVPVTSLLLDPHNPRIPPSGTKLLDQRALIAELVEHDNVIELAKDIAEDGYSPLESLIGLVDEDGKTYILEGNRRLAALKLLLSPDVAPDSASKKIRALAREVNSDGLRKVRVLHAPSRPAAARLIMQKHTRQQIEKWSPLMQARFYRTLADAGLDNTEMAKRYGSTPSEISEFLRTDATYELARLMNLPESIKAVVHNSRKFPVSTLQRLLDAPRAREVLGIDFDGSGAIHGTVNKDEFSKAFARILSDIATEKLTTRTINKPSEDVPKYLAQIKEDLPDKKRKGSFIAADFRSTVTADAAKVVKPSARKPTGKPRQSASVIPSGVKCRIKNTRIVEIFDELRRLRLEKNPNASAVLFRILLELCIGHYLDRTQKIQPLLASAAQKNKGNDWYPTLRQMLDAMLQDKSISIPTLARKKLNRLVSDKTSSLSVDGLDSYVHSRFSPPTARELRHYWDAFEDLFRVILEEPPPPAVKK